MLLILCFNCWMRRPNGHQQAHRHNKCQPWIRHTTMPIQGDKVANMTTSHTHRKKPTLTQPSNAGVDNQDSQHHKTQQWSHPGGARPRDAAEHLTIGNNAKLRWDGNSHLPRNTSHMPTQVVHDHVTLPNNRPSVNNVKLRWAGNSQLPRNTLHMFNTRIMKQMWIYGVGVII